MLPSVPDFLKPLRLELNDMQATEKDTKTKMKLLNPQVNREVAEAVIGEKKRNRGEGDAMGRTIDAWGYVKRSLCLNKPKMDNVLLDGKVIPE